MGIRTMIIVMLASKLEDRCYQLKQATDLLYFSSPYINTRVFGLQSIPTCPGSGTTFYIEKFKFQAKYDITKIYNRTIARQLFFIVIIVSQTISRQIYVAGHISEFLAFRPNLGQQLARSSDNPKFDFVFDVALKRTNSVAFKTTGSVFKKKGQKDSPQYHNNPSQTYILLNIYIACGKTLMTTAWVERPFCPIP